MNHKKGIALTVLLAFSLLLFVGCQDSGLPSLKKLSPQEMIIGEWEGTGEYSQVRFAFKEDGAVELSDVTGVVQGGTYEITNDSELTFRFGVGGPETVRIVSISESELVLALSQGGEDIVTLKKAVAPAAPASGAPAVPAGPPQEAVSLAIKYVEDHHCVLSRGDQCKDYKLACSAKLETTDADRANGIQEKWCFRISYISLPAGGQQWIDLWKHKLVLKRGGVWEVGEDWTCPCKQ